MFEGIFFLLIIMTVVKVAKDNWPLQDSTMLQDPIKPCFKTIWSFIVEHGNITFRLSSSLALTVDHYCTFEKLNQMGASLPSETLLLSVFIKDYRQYRWIYQLPDSIVSKTDFVSDCRAKLWYCICQSSNTISCPADILLTLPIHRGHSMRVSSSDYSLIF